MRGFGGPLSYQDTIADIQMWSISYLHMSAWQICILEPWTQILQHGPTSQGGGQRIYVGRSVDAMATEALHSSKVWFTLSAHLEHGVGKQ